MQVVPAFILFCGGGGRVHWGQVVRLSGVQDLPEVALVLWWRVPSFYPLCCSACGALHLNMALFRVLRAFLARFGGFVWVCVGWVLCVACGAFMCVSG